MPAPELLLHPVRMRIVQAFLGRESLTTGALRLELDDVPVATLYRHVSALLDGGVLEVVDERRVRGAVERTLVLHVSRAHVDAESARTMTREDHRHAFSTFVAGLLGSFDRYLDGDDLDLGRDLVGYRQTALHLTDEETHELLEELRAVVLARAANRPAPGRRRRLLATVLVPAEDRGPSEGSG
ncbi:helix-turn-helix domain-containing protein [Nocardioides caldifontis]|uniref:helix-turn-helix domain-containing protein n=1 Tax=Nocardioides caldifontis TaxID=2588938 RepID=UPI0011E06145|nr:helix-turn-helix domain-containing protein [Nocardioides caldifontis]